MSATTFLLILAAVVIVFVGFVIKSWFELSSTTRTRGRVSRKNKDNDEESDE